MSRKCRGKNGNKSRRIMQALILITFLGVMFANSHYDCLFDINNIVLAGEVSEKGTEDSDKITIEQVEGGVYPMDEQSTEPDEMTEAVETEVDEVQVHEETKEVTDLSEAYKVILQGATKEFLAGYLVDESFLMWLTAEYGDSVLFEIASSVQDREMSEDTWYEATGNSIHVLWVDYCKASGFQTYHLDNVYWAECKNSEETVISFTGDFNFAEDWYTTEYMDAQPNGIYDCFSEELLAEMNESDIMMMNNEFVFSDRGAPLAGKAYTFRASSDRVDLLDVFGVDIVSLANNHTYDFGSEALLDTMEYLEEAGVTYVGAGRDIKEASKIVYYIANGRKIAIVSATEIERSTNYTKEATENTCGVLKTLRPERYIQVILEASKYSDYVIAVTHWGTEGTLYPDSSQKRLAELLVDAGADVIIGGHPHRLQGTGFVKEVPVAYSLGNFWFSDGTLYTTLAQVVIESDGNIRLKFLPCIQKDLTTSLITDTTEVEEFYQYLSAISSDVGVDAEGNIYNKNAADYPAEQIVYDSETSRTGIVGAADNEGNAIDIVGNLK